MDIHHQAIDHHPNWMAGVFTPWASGVIKILAILVLLAANPAWGDELDDAIAGLKAQIAQGTGDGVGILTETAIWIGSGKNGPEGDSSFPRALSLFGQQGSARLYMRYIIRAHSYEMKIAPNLIPGGWPTPALGQVLQLASQARTPILEVTDGHSWWGSAPVNRWKNKLDSIHPRDVDNARAVASVLTAVGAYWPKPQELSTTSWTDSSGAKWSQGVQLAHHPTNASWIGLRILVGVQRPGVPSLLMSNSVIYWLDINRNYVPVGKDIQNYDKRGNIGTTSNTQYLDYGQFADGRWYPTHWRETNTWGVAFNQCSDYRLSFDPQKSLPSTWYGDPQAYFTADTGAPGTPPPTGIAAVPQAIKETAVTAYSTIWWWWPYGLGGGALAVAAVMALLRRRNQAPAPALRGAYGPRRR